MDSALIRKVAGVGIAVVLMFALMYLFALHQVADTTTPAMGKAIDGTLARSLEKGAASRVTMSRAGKGAESTRLYKARFRPSPAVAADKAAVARLCERAADIVRGYLEDVKGAVTIVTVAEDAAGARLGARAFERNAEDGELDEIAVPELAPDPPEETPPR